MDPDNLIRLDDVCVRYFNIGVKNARRKAAMFGLPIPAFRLTTSGKGPFFVRKDVLDKYVTDLAAAAEKQHATMGSVK